MLIRFKNIFTLEKFYMKKLIILITLVYSFISINSQGEYNLISDHQLGLNAGICTGIGLSYKYCPGKIGFQFTFMPIKSDSSWADLLYVQDLAEVYFSYERYQKFISIGLAATYTFKEYNKYKIFSYLGNHYLLNNNDEYCNVGAGVGIAFERRISLNLMVGYGAFDILSGLNLYPTGEIGMFYRFNKNR